MFNPKVKDFIEKNNPSLMGLYWAGLWRFMVAYMVVVIGLAIFFTVMAAIFGN